MLAIVFLGVFQHEVVQTQLRKLLTAVKAEAGDGCVVICNASGLFASAPRLDSQVEMLFDSEINVIFPGEQSVARNAGRLLLASDRWLLIRPANLAETAPGKGIRLFQTVSGRSVYMISLSDGSGRNLVDPAYGVLDAFFRNKSDNLPVLINVDGTDADCRKALFYRYSSAGSPVIFIGSGSGFQSSNAVIDSSGNCYVPDVGQVAYEKTVAGVPIEVWWQKNVERLPVQTAGGWGVLNCDYTIIRLDETGKTQEVIQKTLSI